MTLVDIFFPVCVYPNFLISTHGNYSLQRSTPPSPLPNTQSKRWGGGVMASDKGAVQARLRVQLTWLGVGFSSLDFLGNTVKGKAPMWGIP